MNVIEAKKQQTGPLRQATLCFLIRDQEVLLGMKKRGFGQGKWNGIGGKPEKDEAIDDAAVRETEEEIDVTPTITRVATLNFYFPKDQEAQGWNQQVCVYLANKWHGEPTETEEMAPRWFAFDNVPYDEMWPDDQFWLPQVLQGETLTGDFVFENETDLGDYQVQLGIIE